MGYQEYMIVLNTLACALPDKLSLQISKLCFRYTQFSSISPLGAFSQFMFIELSFCRMYHPGSFVFWFLVRFTSQRKADMIEVQKIRERDLGIYPLSQPSPPSCNFSQRPIIFFYLWFILETSFFQKFIFCRPSCPVSSNSSTSTLPSLYFANSAHRSLNFFQFDLQIVPPASPQDSDLFNLNLRRTLLSRVLRRTS